ncbi:MAG: M15 family metallopeptidase [Synergistaceae bacterium]|jgi:D-alanyl-D-alanine dipeptidase|nr:M15 family metallopeptidase [Synergistaceae bacterium]
MNISTAGVRKSGLPDGFVYIDEIIEDCIVDAKYWGTDNFTGRRIDGYESPLAIMTREAAECCVRAAEILRGQGYCMKIYDAYRPQRAVDDFIRWAADPDDIRRKPIHYPHVDKKDLFALGYLAEKSSHSRGSAVDLTLVNMATCQELDMGSVFDFMDPRSHIDARPLSDWKQGISRIILSEAMTDSGFETYEYEWWHFFLKEEPYPETYFDFPVR